MTRPMVRQTNPSPGGNKRRLLLVEDHPVTAVQAGAEFGHAAILVPEPYNVGISAPGVLRLENRSDLAPAIIDFYKKLEEAGCLIGTGR